MAVAAARDCLGAMDRTTCAGAVLLASATLPFAERLNAGVVAGALDLDESVAALDLTGSQTAALSGFAQAAALAAAGSGPVLLTAADARRTRAASSSELDYGDGAAAFLLGKDRPIAEILAQASITVDFVDRFRLAGQDIDYHWEERWVRDEGIGKIMPRAIAQALSESGVEAAKVDRFIFPSTFAKIDAVLAKKCGIAPEVVVANLADKVGDTGVAHGLLLLAQVLETATPGQIIVLAQFGSGARVLVLRVTEHIKSFKPRLGVSGWLDRGVIENSYTRFLVYKDQLQVERGMRGEQDKKTALTTAYRHRRAILGLVAGRCSVTGQVHYPPSRYSYTQGAPALDTQEPLPAGGAAGYGVELVGGIPLLPPGAATPVRTDRLRWRRPHPVGFHRCGAGRYRHRHTGGDGVPHQGHGRDARLQALLLEGDAAPRPARGAGADVKRSIEQELVRRFFERWAVSSRRDVRGLC